MAEVPTNMVCSTRTPTRPLRVGRIAVALHKPSCPCSIRPGDYWITALRAKVVSASRMRRQGQASEKWRRPALIAKWRRLGMPADASRCIAAIDAVAYRSMPQPFESSEGACKSIRTYGRTTISTGQGRPAPRVLEAEQEPEIRRVIAEPGAGAGREHGLRC